MSEIRTKPATDAYRDGWDRCFGRKAARAGYSGIDRVPVPYSLSGEEMTRIEDLVSEAMRKMESELAGRSIDPGTLSGWLPRTIP